MVAGRLKTTGGSDAATRFRALHERKTLFVMPNPWDAGTARLLAGMGFEALATSSAAMAWALGKADVSGAVSRDEALQHSRIIAAATDLPVNGDLESGFGDTPQDVAGTIRGAIEAGLAGCSIEDLSRDSKVPLYDIGLAVERIAAARAAIDAAGSDFVLTGRTEVFFTGHERPLDEAVRRLRAYRDAGADVIYAPGVTTPEEVRALVGAAGCPVNVLGGLGGVSDDIPALRELGVRRVSIGSGLAKVALGAFLSAAERLRAHDVFAYEGAAPSARLNGAFGVEG
jgi:2-methylisocitrate lyase-like PEP mutase family enzyme